MTAKNNDVEDLYSELERTLSDDSGEDTPGASAEDDTAEDGAAADEKSEEATEEEGAEDKADDVEGDDEIEGFTKEEFSKLSTRAQKRIRELAAQKDGKSEDEPAEEKQDEKDVTAEDFNTIEDFLAAVKDEPSRKMLEMFAKVMDKTQSSKIRPLLEKSASELFETKFAAFEKIEGMSAHKEDLRKTFMRNPGADLKALVGEKLVDLQTSRIKPTEKKPSTPSHGGAKPNLDGLSKDELYDQLESLKE